MFLLKMKKHFLRTTYKIFCLKDLSRAINWEQLSGGRYLEGNYPGVFIQGTIIQVPIVRVQFVWGPLSGDNYLGAVILGAIVQGAIVLESIKP